MKHYYINAKTVVPGDLYMLTDQGLHFRYAEVFIVISKRQAHNGQWSFQILETYVNDKNGVVTTRLSTCGTYTFRRYKRVQRLK